MLVSTKTRPVIDFFPCTEVGADASETRAIEELIEYRDLVFATTHAGLKQTRDECGHAEIGLGGLYPEPIGDFVAQRDRQVLHVTKIV